MTKEQESIQELKDNGITFIKRVINMKSIVFRDFKKIKSNSIKERKYFIYVAVDKAGMNEANLENEIETKINLQIKY